MTRRDCRGSEPAIVKPLPIPRIPAAGHARHNSKKAAPGGCHGAALSDRADETSRHFLVDRAMCCRRTCRPSARTEEDNSMTTRRQFFGIAAAAMSVPALPDFACADQAWPARSIRAMIPFSAGSSIDIVGRIVLDPLSKLL